MARNWSLKERSGRLNRRARSLPRWCDCGSYGLSLRLGLGREAVAFPELSRNRARVRAMAPISSDPAEDLYRQIAGAKAVDRAHKAVKGPRSNAE